MHDQGTLVLVDFWLLALASLAAVLLLLIV
jgi:hypothetical protein